MKSQLLERLVTLAGQHARLCLVEFKMQTLLPQWLLLSSVGEVKIIGTPWNSKAEMWDQTARIKEEMRRRNSIAYSLVCESWVANAPKGWRPTDPGPGPVETMPRRWEEVQAIAATATRHLARDWRIVRNDSGEIIDLVEREDSSQVISPFANLLASDS